jgi:hypothetical protein
VTALLSIRFMFGSSIFHLHQLTISFVTLLISNHLVYRLSLWIELHLGHLSSIPGGMRNTQPRIEPYIYNIAAILPTTTTDYSRCSLYTPPKITVLLLSFQFMVRGHSCAFSAHSFLISAEVYYLSHYLRLYASTEVPLET